MKIPFARKKAPTTESPAAAEVPEVLGRCAGLNGSDIVELGGSHAVCLATNRIMVDGAPIRFALRNPDRVSPHDSGWRFFAGDEDDVYMDEVSNHGVYAINTVANYDSVIIPILDEALGTAWVRDGDILTPTPKDSRRRVTDSHNDNRYYPYLLKPMVLASTAAHTCPSKLFLSRWTA